MDEEKVKKGRIAYITEIMQKLNLSQGTLIPTATEERFFEEALRHVVHVVSSKDYAPAKGTFSSDLSACSKTRDRKQCLKKILDQLCWLERKRLYDPPADNEIAHYLLIKKYTRSIVTFHLAAARDQSLLDATGDNFFGSLSLFLTLQHVEGIMEINQHLADLSEFLLEMDTKDVFTLAPLMHTKNSYEMTPIINGSKERSYMFYNHKFKLASADLQSYSEFAFGPPLEDEERSYVQALDSVSSPLIGARDGMNVFSEELYNLYIKEIHQLILDIERHFEKKIKGWILKNLSLVDWWQTGERHFIEQITNIRYGIYENDEDGEILPAELQKELSEKCEVSNGDLPDYIVHVDRCLTIALLVDAMTDACSEVTSKLHVAKVFRKLKQLGWEAVHAFTLLKLGFPVGSELQEQLILRNPKKHVPLENYQDMRKHEYILHKKGQDENVVILEGIIDYLKYIGDSYMVLDEEERILVHKIWGNVASSIHFYISAIAYEQRPYVMQHYDSFDTSMLKLPAAKTNRTINVQYIRNKKREMKENITNFAQILIAFKNGLEEKLRSS